MSRAKQKKIQEDSDEEIAKQISVKYTDIVTNIQVIKTHFKMMLEGCVGISPLASLVKDRNKNRMAWWFKTYCPNLNYAKLKKFESIAKRTGDINMIQSWQLRLLGLVSTIHHKDKIIKKKRVTRPKKKSWVYHVSKGHEGLIKQIEQMGGLDKLTEEEKESISSQFGSLGDILIKMKR